MPLRKCYFPTLAVYNLNFMGLSSKQRRNARLSMVRHLMESHQIVGLEELHADTKRDANMFFFEHIHATKFYDSTVNMAILVNTEWANTHSPHHVDIVPDPAHGIQWNSGAGRCFFIHIYLDATPATAIKVDQLNRIKQWATANIQPSDTIFIGGDRNHIRQVSERVHSDGTKSTIYPSVVRAWDECMAALNFCAIVQQDQFTFKRKREGVTTLSLIDVVGSSADSIAEPLYAPFFTPN